jgi:hypothetical protein
MKHHHRIIIERLATHFSKGKKCRVRNARRFQSSETGFPRRIKDVEALFGVVITRTRVLSYYHKLAETEYSIGPRHMKKLSRKLALQRKTK